MRYERVVHFQFSIAKVLGGDNEVMVEDAIYSGFIEICGKIRKIIPVNEIAKDFKC